MSQIAQFIRLAPMPGQQDVLLAALAVALASAADEPGTLAYAVHVADDSDIVWLYELYEDSEAHREHSASAATARLRHVFATALATSPEVQRGRPVASFGTSKSPNSA